MLKMNKIFNQKYRTIYQIIRKKSHFAKVRLHILRWEKFICLNNKNNKPMNG